MKSAINSRIRFVLAISVSLSLMVVFLATRRKKDAEQLAQPTEVELEKVTDEGESLTRESTIEEVLELAESSLKNMGESLTDYTATFVKQDLSSSGTLNAPSKMSVKIQTRMRNQSDDAPMRIYLKFLEPSANAGREVIWGADLNTGKMAVHETYLPLSWRTLWLDPEGPLAMAGQRFPIWEIGLVRLVEQLIERGKADLNNPNVSVMITREHSWQGTQTKLIRVKRSEPSDSNDDFSLAEVIFDPDRMLILSYRSFGWAEEPGGAPPLLESYEYQDLETNVGLEDLDFDVSNPSYAFP